MDLFVRAPLYAPRCERKIWEMDNSKIMLRGGAAVTQLARTFNITDMITCEGILSINYLE